MERNFEAEYDEQKALSNLDPNELKTNSDDEGEPYTEKANLCKCTNCNTVYVDQNSQTGAKVYNVQPGQYPDLQYNENWNDPADDKGVWICPNCDTDDYLVDL